MSKSAHGLALLEEQVRSDLDKLAYPARAWVKPLAGPEGQHVYDVVVIGGGQCGLATAFGLMRESVTNVLVLDENSAGKEGPWVTYARMVTLRTNKALTGPDLGVPSLTFQAYYEAKYGPAAWSSLDKIPKEEWMAYLVWYRRVLNLPVHNGSKVQLIEPLSVGERGHIFKLSVSVDGAPPTPLWARKVVLATGIQGGGEWHVPHLISSAVPPHLYAHTSQPIDFERLKGKKVAILGGGASAFDNAQYGLERGVGEVHVFVRRSELPRINPIRYMEFAGFLRHFADLDDATKYAAINFFLQFNQPPTNCTFNRACKFPNFHLHTGSPWEKLSVEGDQVRVVTPTGEGLYDFLIVSTGLLTDTKLRPELAAVAGQVATWADRYVPACEEERNALVDQHPYLGMGFEFQEKVPGSAPYLRGIFAYNYSALVSLGLSASALSGMKYAINKLLGGITKQLFLDDQQLFVSDFLNYRTEEFLGQWPPAAAPVASAAAGQAGPVCAGAEPAHVAEPERTAMVEAK